MNAPIELSGPLGRPLAHLRRLQQRILRSTRASYHPTEPATTRRRALSLLPWAVLLTFAITLFRNAWVSDDAFIAFRAVSNLNHGFGLVSNPGERVQAFTNPLWILLMSVVYSVTGESFFSSIQLSIALSVAAVAILLFRVSRRPLDALCLGIVLPFSRAFTDYSTSGLENPLTHLLLALLLPAYFRSDGSRRSLLAITTLASLLLVTRLDNAWLVLPVLLHAWWGVRTWRTLPWALLGLLPLFAWEAFSILYYGFPYPNTAYAKLTTDLPASTLLMQGAGYLVDSLSRDPVTLLVIGLGGAAAFVSRSFRGGVAMLGVAFHLLYVVSVGGDFMSGRFLTAPFFVAVLALSAWGLPLLPVRQTLTLGAALAVVVLCAPFNPFKHGHDPCAVDDNGIADERDCYFQTNGLLHNFHRVDDQWGYQTHAYWKAGLKKREAKNSVVADTLVGMGGYAAGPHVHVVDTAALTDPLLARIPFRPKAGWRIGHFYRDVPEGYLDTLRGNHNVIKNPCLARYYDQLSVVVRGPIFSVRRLGAIVALNLGRLDYLVAPSCAESPNRAGEAQSPPLRPSSPPDVRALRQHGSPTIARRLVPRSPLLLPAQDASRSRVRKSSASSGSTSGSESEVRARRPPVSTTQIQVRRTSPAEAGAPPDLMCHPGPRQDVIDTIAGAQTF